MLEKIQDTRDFLEECWDELRKVTWPDYEQLRSVTIVVILFSIAVSLVIWIMDITVRQALEFIMGIFGA
jgi:preprotein translocase subunit SecE